MAEGKREKAPHADAATSQKRVDDVLRLRLDGAEFWNVREFVREKEAESGSNWFVAQDASPLSDSQIRRYQAAADKLVTASHERSRKRLFRRHLAQRRRLYHKATTAGDLRTALACVQDEAKLIGLYPSEKHEHSHNLDALLAAELARIAGTRQGEAPRPPAQDPDA